MAQALRFTQPGAFAASVRPARMRDSALESLARQGDAYEVCPSCKRELSRAESRRRCRKGYHGMYTRVRTKSRARHHGNSTGQSKGGQK